MNNVVLVGRLVEDPIIENLEDKKTRTIINIAISRDYRNSEGYYDTDIIKCVLWNGIASSTKEYCRKGDVVSIKGKLQSHLENDKNVLEVVADKITFINARKEDE